MVRTTTLACLISLASPAVAQSPPSAAVGTGNTFLSNCGTERGFFQSGICYGYLSGYLDREEMEATRAFCRPADTTNRQLMDIFLDYLRRNPKERHYDTPILMLFAFATAFPCPK